MHLLYMHVLQEAKSPVPVEISSEYFDYNVWHMYMQDSTQSFFEAFSSGHNLVTEKANLCVCVLGGWKK